ncbi:uncharacterized protein [Petaurus breviceps papuanus]|uniref:uncharacterized protein isoform X2 n=1 Tax=Petaurus breviceps papuanus TaxID=3040969 RepID=UPI0036DBCAE4
MISGEEEEEVTWMDRFGMRKRIFSFKRLFGLKRNNTAVGKEIQNNFGITDKGNQRPVELNIFPAKQPYIPYALAKAYITKMTKDMHQMHLKYTQIAQKMELRRREEKNDYSSKIKTLKGRFEAYQEQVNKKNRSWQDTMKILVEKTDELMQEKNKLLLQVNQEKEKWEKEKRWLLEIFAQKLDLLHTHHSVTAQKIKATRLALENIQGILKFPNVQKNENLSSEKVISWIFSNEAEPEFTDAFEKMKLRFTELK